MKTYLILKAANFAAEKHKYQKRIGDVFSPYINHTLSVALILSEIGEIEDEEILIAALLHDILENTNTTQGEIHNLFGSQVRKYVEEVTEEKSIKYEDVEKKQFENTAKLSPGAALIKLAAKISNLVDITNNPPANWELKRCIQYFYWAEAVVGNLPKVNEKLENEFLRVLAEGRYKLSEIK